jgi:hypothetical protein
MVEVQAANAPPSRLHSNVEGSEAPNVNVAEVRRVVPEGPEVIVVSGAIVSGTTVNEDRLVSEPIGVVTEIGPVVAPLGTVARMSVDLMTVKAAGVPFTVTEVAPAKNDPQR